MTLIVFFKIRSGWINRHANHDHKLLFSEPSEDDMTQTATIEPQQLNIIQAVNLAMEAMIPVMRS